MKTIAIIPARYQSTRFPGKPLADIRGKTMIQCVYEQVQKAKSVDKIIVATDDARIMDAVKQFGGNATMTASHHQSGTERCGEVIASENSFEVVINVQGDEPFIRPEQIDLLAATFINDKTTEIASLAKPSTDSEEINNHNRVKVTMNKNNEALYFSRLPIPYGSKNYYIHIGMYAYRADVLRKIVTLSPTALEKSENLEQLRWLENGYKIKMQLTEQETIGIDTPEDLKLAVEKFR